ncbi:zinc-binding alcohol dehydrogenase family protein [Aspergillus candidus]|uniref:Putative quinone oxidoreductase n=1 Tax=Aspergillus candidus TaxID=41067 RepID=A0A2I2FBH8_ASPCN|nr:putative quinone oxidoreductase [Aspergillus candidus]PLB37986.1 putative quinone oxidoreductase [Aspergillus candidus]
MKEAVVRKDTSVDIVDAPIPKPGPGYVLIKVIVAGTNPKDWKVPIFYGSDMNTGDDIAGIVEAVGEDVVGFNKGDRVAAFHEMMASHGAFAEYALAPYYTTFHIPDSTTFEEAATIPLAAYTSVCALFQELELPEPWSPLSKAAGKDGTKRPLLIYGASTATGAFAVKLAAAANIHPIITVGSKRSEFIRPFLDESKGDVLVDYTAYPTGEELINAIQQAVKKGGAPDGRCWKAFDSVSEDDTIRLVTKVIAGPPDAAGRRPKMTNIMLKTEVEGSDPSVDIVFSMVGQVHTENENDRLIGVAWGAAFARGLREGWLTGHPYTIGKNGLEGLSDGLKGLKDGNIRAQKILTRLSETPGASD